MGLFESGAVGTIAGGVLIGLAFAILMLLTGRIMSASGMIGSLLGGAEGVAATSITFIGGIVTISLVLTVSGFAQQQVIETTLALLVIGGFVVGVSARLTGASLGAAVTGIARRTPRSALILATILVGAALGGFIQVLVVGGSGA